LASPETGAKKKERRKISFSASGSASGFFDPVADRSSASSLSFLEGMNGLGFGDTGGPGMDIGSIIANILGGGVGGGILMAIIGAIKKAVKK
jgi:hypothetical protein